MRARRPDGWLEARICELLEASDTPLSGQAIARRLSAQHDHIFLSAVFRAVSQLLARDRIGRVELLAGYVRKREELALGLVCADCHRVTFIPVPETGHALQRIAAVTGYRAGRLIAEIRGVCRACQATQQRSPARA